MLPNSYNGCTVEKERYEAKKLSWKEALLLIDMTSFVGRSGWQPGKAWRIYLGCVQNTAHSSLFGATTALPECKLKPRELKATALTQSSSVPESQEISDLQPVHSLFPNIEPVPSCHHHHSYRPTEALVTVSPR